MKGERCIYNNEFPCNIGISENTKQKEKDIRRWFRLHQTITSYVINKSPYAEKRYYYFDIGSGPGMCKKLEEMNVIGSPIQFINSLNGVFNKNKIRMYLFEQTKPCCDRLNSVLKNEKIDYEIRYGLAEDNVMKCISDLPQARRYGLVYMDYNGAADFWLLKKIASNPKTKCLDMMVNIPIGWWKCQMGWQKNNPKMEHKNILLPLEEVLKIKNYVSYKGPKPGNFKWTLFYLSNGPQVAWKKEGWLTYDGKNF